MKASVNGIDINYEIHGKEGAPWITFSHSLACSVRMWDPQIAAFKDRFRILVHDMRGHGDTSAPAGPYSLEQLASDVAGLLKHVGIKKTHFVGLSIGGMIGQILADKHSALVERVVLADTGHTAQNPELLKQWEERIATAQTKGMKPLVEPTLARWFTEPFRKSSPDKVAKIAALIENTPAPGYVGCCQAISKLNLTSRLKEIKVPVLAITGEQDGSAAGTKFIGENIPGARFVGIPQAAHIANVEQPEAFNRALRDFLSSPASAPA
jgi:3-oxoadipate enol-lactonase